MREAGALARKLTSKPLEVQTKGQLGPVTNVDFAVDALVAEMLQAARPDYGWLSEESPDDPAQRMDAARTFMIDPIDGTAAMIAKAPQWTISLGIVEGERPFAGAIYNPMTDEMYLGADGVQATLNGRPVAASVRTSLEGATMVGQRFRFSDRRWKTPWPAMQIVERQSIAYRLATVASGQADATALFGWKNDWDVAAGAAIVAAAGGRVSDLWGAPLQLNQQRPRVPGVAAAGAALHPLLIERTAAFPDPRLSS